MVVNCTMISKKYLKGTYASKITYPDMKGLAYQVVLTDGNPPIIVNGILILQIGKTYCLKEMDTNKEYEIFKTQSNYEIPVSDILEKKDLTDIYNDAEKNLFDLFKETARNTYTPLITFPDLRPVENNQEQIDYIFQNVLRR